MKNKTFIITIIVGVIAVVATWVIARQTIRPKIEIEIDTNNIGKDNTILDYKGSYYDLMLVRNEAMMNNKLYDVYSGWISPYSNVYFDNDGVSMSVYNNGNKVIGSEETELYDGVSAELNNIFIIDNGSERPITFNDQIKIKDNKFFTFKAFCKPEAEPLGFFGLVAKACGPDMGPYYLECDKIVFQNPNEGEDLKFKAEKLYDSIYYSDRNFYESGLGYGIVPMSKQGMQLVTFKTDLESDLKQVAYIPSTIVEDDSSFVLKVDGFKEPIDIKSSGWLYNLDNSMIKNYDVSGKYLCSPFNEFCFFRVNKIIVNSNLRLDQNNDVIFDNFKYINTELFNDPSISYKSGKWLLRVPNNGEWLKDFDINVSDYVDNNIYLKDMKTKSEEDNYNTTYGKLPTGDYTIETSGKFNCGGVYKLIQGESLLCMVEPNSFKLEMTKQVRTTSTTQSGNIGTSSNSVDDQKK